MTRISRRTCLAGGIGTLAGLRVGIDAAAAQALAPLRWAALQPGFTILPIAYIGANGLARKHGMALGAPERYTAVSTYYNDFVAGNYDVCIGSWDTFASRYVAGVPIQYLCTITTADMVAVLAPGGGITDIAQIKGKIFAGLQSTGTYRLLKALIHEVKGIDIEKDATVQSVDNPAASMTLLMADRADAAMSWEPSISTALIKMPSLKVIFDAGQAYREHTGLTLPYFGVAIRKDLIAKEPGIAAKVNAMFQDCLAGINADPAKAVDEFGPSTGSPPDVLKLAMASGRMTMAFQSMTDPAARETITKASEFLVRNGLLPHAVDDGFFAA